MTNMVNHWGRLKLKELNMEWLKIDRGILIGL